MALAYLVRGFICCAGGAAQRDGSDQQPNSPDSLLTAGHSTMCGSLMVLGSLLHGQAAASMAGEQGAAGRASSQRPAPKQ